MYHLNTSWLDLVFTTDFRECYKEKKWIKDCWERWFPHVVSGQSVTLPHHSRDILARMPTEQKVESRAYGALAPPFAAIRAMLSSEVPGIFSTSKDSLAHASIMRGPAPSSRCAESGKFLILYWVYAEGQGIGDVLEEAHMLTLADCRKHSLFKFFAVNSE